MKLLESDNNDSGVTSAMVKYQSKVNNNDSREQRTPNFIPPENIGKPWFSGVFRRHKMGGRCSLVSLLLTLPCDFLVFLRGIKWENVAF